jgi:hypothetical protein
MKSHKLAGTKSQIQAVIDAQILKPLINLAKSGDFDIKKEGNFWVE